MTYAAATDVPVDRSRAELERTLERYGATAFGYGWDAAGARIVFQAHGRRVAFHLPLPDRNAPTFTRHARGPRTPEAAHKLWEQVCRSRWRALNLVVKAKLEAVEAGISTFEDEFLAHTMLPNGATVGEWIGPQIVRAYEAGGMPAMLPALGAGSSS